MKSTFIKFAVYLAAVVCCFHANAQTGIRYTVKGNISGLKNDSVVLFAKRGAKGLAVNAINGSFSFTGSELKPGNAYLSFGGSRSRRTVSFFLEAGTIEIKGHIDSLEKAVVSGTPSNDDLTAERLREDVFYDQVKLLQARLKNETLSETEKKGITARINALRDSVRRVRLQFIAGNPQSLASPLYLRVEEDGLSLEQLEKLYNAFHEPVKSSDYGVGLAEKITARRRTAIGNPAPDFSVNDINGKPVQLSAYRGQYVLLEFWASWCVPCRHDNPYLVKAHERYKDKKFTILSVSLDHDGAKWKEAIEKDQLNWTHISDLQAFDNKVAKLYGVQPIPDNFLISPEGKIIARRLRGPELEKALAELIH